ncbi:unnamed protein product [Spirodela intermedia]|uniref:Laccase n=1 Tax=Spirodela intermedia TaxID=51605 RepID=A0A7I8IHB3_SPIIN|nr:unnamed protein product [Spirodela intermedia]CAA6656766.1 unnamed protein product [Spirodela intermedia]
MARFLFVACTLLLVSAVARAGIVKYTFNVSEMKIRRLCQERTIVTVNGLFPGPTINAREGDAVVIRVVNQHGIFQLLSGWADGPSYVTQCPIRPGNSYTYRFKIVGQEGTLWWHAHVSFLRATVHGALIILPRAGTKAYPFPKPYREVPSFSVREWWNANVVDVEDEALTTGRSANISDAFTINGSPGDLYPCSSDHTFKLAVLPGKTYLLRIINSALNSQLFFKIAGHSLTVVAIDAAYTTPYRTEVVVLAPGQTIDALLAADAPPACYYMAANAYDSLQIVPFDNTTTTGILYYASAGLPSNLTGLLYKGTPPVPLQVDERMFITIGMNLVPCDHGGAGCLGPFGEKFAASMNNVSFQLPSKMSLLQAHFSGVPGIYTLDFPDRPPAAFDYSNRELQKNLELLQTAKATRVKRLKYNSTMEIAHPVHLHGFNFFVLAQGFGNYDPAEAEKLFNLVHPQVRNTIAVPVAGWAVIRFVANNPGVWVMHCHLDTHLPYGLATVFLVENGPTAASTLPPPPKDLPRC